jgi:hypothetical protein
VTTLGSTEIPIEGNTSSNVYWQPRRETTRKRKNKSLPSSNGKRIDPSGGVSIMFLEKEQWVMLYGSGSARR